MCWLLKVRNHLEDLVAKLTLEDQLHKKVLVFELAYSFVFILFKNFTIIHVSELMLLIFCSV